MSFDLLVIGGGALLLRDLITRPTMDLDAMARLEDGKVLAAKPLPDALVEAIRDVADTLGLQREPKDDKDWLNAGPTFLLTLGLPDGFEQRAEVRKFHNLTLRIGSRQDLITLKLWAATDIRRGARRAVDVDDLVELAPTDGELRAALAWCALKDGRDGFIEQEARPVLAQLGRGADWDPS